MARDIAYHFGRNDRTPTICGAMRKAMNSKDAILFAHSKGNSTTLKIKYILD